MLSNSDIKDIIDEAEKKNHRINTKDVAYAILCTQIEDISVSYRCIFGNDGMHDAYDRTENVEYTKQAVEYVIQSKMGKKGSGGIDYSFEENKKYMLKLKDETEQAMHDGQIEKKDALKILADLSVKLNDKFGVKDTSANQMVNVLTKYNDICPYCMHEISRRPISKNEAMEMYNLIESR